MIRTIAAIAALVAVPTLASAQTTDEIVVYGHRDTYSIVVNVAGMSPRQAYRQIARAADEACNRVQADDVLSISSSEDMSTCVDRARQDAERQYDELRTDYY